MITNDKPSYVAKEDSICLLSIAREAVLNKQQIKPFVPFSSAMVYNCPTGRVYLCALANYAAVHSGKVSRGGLVAVAVGISDV